MNQVLIARKLPRLEKTCICVGKSNPYLVQSWMRAALDRNAKELEVYFSKFSVDHSCELTNSLFVHNKLVILKLCVDMTLNFQAKSCVFPNLKFFELDSITYRDEDSLPNLLTSCPILEDLTINSTTGRNLGTLNLISRSVKRLKVHDESGMWVCVDKLVFDTPALESLDISFGIKEGILVKDLSRLVDAKVDILTGYLSDIYDLLRGVSNAKFLKLDGCTVEAIVRSDAYDFPLFYNLTRLEIYGDSRCEDNESSDVIPAKILVWELLIEILQFTPMLEHLIYQACDRSKEDRKESVWDVCRIV